MKRAVLISYIAEGLSQRQIATSADCSHTNVRYWLKRYGLSTVKHRFYCCKFCGERDKDQFMNKGHGRKAWSLCKRCHNRQSIERFRQRKQQAVEYKGGRCQKCGYDRCVAALEFHHRDSTSKDRSFDANYLKKIDFEKVKQELDKCDLLCANCHREVHQPGL